MKIHRVLTSLTALLVAFLALTVASAQEKNVRPTVTEKRDHAPEWAELFRGASLPSVWQSALAANEKIATALAAENLTGIPSWAETIHLAAHALADQVKIDPVERAKRLKGTLEQTAKIADHVLHGANHQAMAETADAHRRLNSALMLAKIRLPIEITTAPKQETRFATFPDQANAEQDALRQKKK